VTATYVMAMEFKSVVHDSIHPLCRCKVTTLGGLHPIS
jgi:hypothetical protein